MESEEEVNAVLDRLYRVLLFRENARIYRKTDTIDTEFTPEEQDIYDTILEGVKKRGTL